MGSLVGWLRSLIPKRGFGRGVALVAGGTALGQAITIAASPVLTRLFTPADFGMLAVYTSITGIAGVVCTLAYHSAIPLPTDDQEGADLLGLSLLGVAATAAIMTALVVFAGDDIARATKAPELAPFLWLVPLGILGLGSYETLTQWAVRERNYRVIATTSIVRGAAQVGSQLGMGVLAVGGPGLLAGQLLGQCSGTATLARAAWHSSKRVIRGISLSGIRKAAARHWRFPAYSLPAAGLNAVSANSPVLILAYYFGGTVTGMYMIGLKVLAVPFSTISHSAQKVFYPTAIEAHRDGHLAESTRVVFDKLFAIALPATLLIAVAAPEGFATVFGSDWRQAGVFMQWMCLRTGLTLVVFPLIPLINVLEQQQAGTIFQGLQLVARVGALVVGGIAGSAVLAVALQGAATGLCWLVFLVYLLSISGNSLTSVLPLIGRRVAVALLLVSPVVIAKVAHMPDFVVTAAAGLCGTTALILAVRGGSPVMGAASNDDAQTGE